MKARRVALLSLISLFTIMNGLSSSQSIHSTPLQITNSTGHQIFPFTSQQLSTVRQCGIVHSVQFKEQQVIKVRFSQPFVAIIWSNNTAIKMSGYGESADPMASNFETELILFRQCSNSITFTKYWTIIDIYSARNNAEPVLLESHKIPSSTYCISSTELQSLSQALNIGYCMIWGVVFSLIPVFPIGNKILNFIILGCIAVCFFTNIAVYEITLAVGLIVLVYLLYDGERMIVRLPFEFKKDILLSLKSYSSIFISFAIVNVMLLFMGPHPYWALGAADSESNSSEWQAKLYEEPTALFELCLYLQNILWMMAVLHLFCQVIWINRLRGLFWWTMLVLAYIYVKESANLALPVNRKFGFLLPAWLQVDSCHYHSMDLIMLMMPACLFMNRFMEIKSAGAFVMITIILFSNFSSYVTMGMIMLWVIIWLISSACQEGYLKAIQSKWIPNCFLKQIS